MAFLHRTLSLPIRRVCACGLVAVIRCVAAASEATAARPPRAERIAIRRIERIEVLERRAEAAAEMPPRPADVRRLLRQGVPLSEIMPKPPTARGGSAAPTAAAQRPATAATRGATPPLPRQPMASAARPPAAEPPLRFPEQPAVAQESMPAAAGSATGVTPATALDDGTRSVLVREEPTPAPPAELLPTPQPK